MYDQFVELKPNARRQSTGSVHLKPNPVRIFQAHEVHPDDDVDWTQLDGGHGWTVEQRLREMRNHLIKEQLLRGLTVQYKPGGNSMHPYIHTGDTCIFEPVDERTPLGVGDIVFCQAQPRDYFFAHWITKTYKPAGSARKYIITNNRRHVNGWCHRKHIYGKLVEAVYVEESRLRRPRA